MRQLSWQQALVTTACLIAIVCSHYLGSKDNATVVALCVMVFNWLREPPRPPPGAPTAHSVMVGLAFVILGTVASTAFAHS